MPTPEFVDFQRLSASRLFRDYVHHFDALSAFYSGDPRKQEAWARIAEARARQSFPTEQVARCLRRNAERLGSDESAAHNIDAFEAGALVVVSGQQSGLFGGPLYTLYKALSAVAHAERASEWLGTPVVPIFWVAGDDHDFEEVRHAYALDSDHQLVELSLALDPSDRRPVGSRTLGEDVLTAIDQLRQTLPDSEFRDEVLTSLAEDYAVGTGMSEAFARWIARLSRGTGLIIANPTDPELKSLAAPLFESELAQRGRTNDIVADTSSRLRNEGYHTQVTVTPDRLNLFYADPDRLPIAAGPEGYVLLNDQRSPLDETALESHPERFSPNVLLRPLYQDSLFPTLAYVAGPSELAYFAQIGGLYEHFDIAMPLVVPRASMSFVEPAQRRFIEKHRVDLSALNVNDESLLNELVRQSSLESFDGTWAQVRRCIEESMTRLEEKVGGIDSTLSATARKTKGRLLHELKELEKKTLRAAKKNDTTLKRQFEATRNCLFPGFVPQERKLSAFSFLNRYGWHFCRMVRDNIDLDVTAHRVVYL